MEKKSFKETVRKGAALGLAFLCSIGVLLAGRPEAGKELADLPEPVAVIAQEDEADDETRRRALAHTAVRKKAGSVARTLIGVPLWAVGSVLLWLGKKLLKLISSAVLPPLLHWLGLFALLALALFLLAKLLFPGIRFRDIFRAPVLLILGIGSLLLEAGDIILSRCIDNFDRFGLLYFFVGGILLLGAALIPVRHRYMANRPPKEEPEEVETSFTVVGSAESGEEA